MYSRNRTPYENFKLKLCTCAQSHPLGTHTNFQLAIIIVIVIFGIAYFRDIILEILRNVNETTPDLGSVSLFFFSENSNSTKIPSCCNSNTGLHIVTKFCTSHDNAAVVTSAKFYSMYFLKIHMITNQNFHRIWIALKKYVNGVCKPHTV